MSSTTAGAPASPLLRLLLRSHLHAPGWVAAAVAAGGWLALLIGAAHDPTHLVGVDATHRLAEAITHAAVMSAAMMAPLVVPHATWVGSFSFWRRRYRAIAVFLAGYLGVWTAISAAVLVVGPRTSSTLGWRTTLVVAFAVAITWSALPGRRRRLQRCGLTIPLAPDGWRADADCLRYGFAIARPCVSTCGPLMVAVTIDHGLVVMALATALSVADRRTPVGAGRSTAAVAALGVLALALAP